MNDVWASDQTVHKISSKLNLNHPCEAKEMPENVLLAEYFKEISREHFLRPQFCLQMVKNDNFIPKQILYYKYVINILY